MESAIVLTPPPPLVVLCFLPTSNTPEGPEHEKNTKSMHGEKFYQLHTETTTAVAIVLQSHEHCQLYISEQASGQIIST